MRQGLFGQRSKRFASTGLRGVDVAKLRNIAAACTVRAGEGSARRGTEHAAGREEDGVHSNRVRPGGTTQTMGLSSRSSGE